MMNQLSLRGPALVAGGFLCLVSIPPLAAHDGCADAAKLPGAPPAVTHQVTTPPPLPPGVVDLSFREFFENPVGPRGLVLTEKLRSLDGRRVRLIGHRVVLCHSEPGRFILAAVPVQMHEHEYGQADELPASAVLVRVPQAEDRPVPFTPGRMAVIGTLSVGSREEPDGRVFHVRLTVDEEPPAESGAASTAAAK